jgi:hypothetical protein
LKDFQGYSLKILQNQSFKISKILKILIQKPKAAIAEIKLYDLARIRKIRVPFYKKSVNLAQKSDEAH